MLRAPSRTVNNKTDGLSKETLERLQRLCPLPTVNIYRPVHVTHATSKPISIGGGYEVASKTRWEN